MIKFIKYLNIFPRSTRLGLRDLHASLFSPEESRPFFTRFSFSQHELVSFTHPWPLTLWVYAPLLFLYYFLCLLALFYLMGFLVGELNSSCEVLTCRGLWSARRVPGYAYTSFLVFGFLSETPRTEFFHCYKIVPPHISIWIFERLVFLFFLLIYPLFSVF